MATNTVHELGTNLEVVIAGKVSGNPVAYGQIPGVAETSSESGTNRLVMQTCGVYNLTVGEAVNAGDILYLTGAGALTKTVGSNVRFGYALETQAGAGTIKVKVGY